VAPNHSCRFAKGKNTLLDLCCGRGGDILKWNEARVGFIATVHGLVPPIGSGLAQHSTPLYSHVQLLASAADRALAGACAVCLCTFRVLYHLHAAECTFLQLRYVRGVDISDQEIVEASRRFAEQQEKQTGRGTATETVWPNGIVCLSAGLF